MTLQSTKSHLMLLLDDSENKVIALSGKWGTGKSYLWREIKDSSNDHAVQNALYVSLFGLANMNQLRLKIIQSAIPNAEAHPATWEKVGVVLSGIKKTLSAVHKGFSALEELALLAVPTILKDRVIVLDDIERKHEKLSIDEILGFIDEFTQLHGARIVLILNSDQLVDRSVWDKLREKVVDQEIRLDTSPDEALAIAISLTPSKYGEQIRKAVQICGLTNIRILRKVIRVVNFILEGQQQLSEAVLSRVIPSTVLLAAINYKGLDDGLNFDFVLKAGGHNRKIDNGQKNIEPDTEGKQQAKSSLLLRELGIHSCDDYELFVIEYLKSGLYDVSDVEKIINHYVAEEEAMKTRQLAQQLHEHIFWHHELTEQDLLAEARALAQDVHLIDAYNVTSLHKVVSEIDGGQEVADMMITNWLSAFQNRSVDQDFEHDSSFSSFLGPLHPLIKAEFDLATSRAQARTTVYDACEYVAKNSGWGHRQEVAMKSATIQDFELTIKTLNPNDLKLFMCRMLDMCIHRNNYELYFGSAMDYFIDACKNICSDPQAGRLGRLIRLLFEDAKLTSVLE